MRFSVNTEIHSSLLICRKRVPTNVLTILLFRHMKRQTIDGQTGHLQFNEEGDRLNPIYWIKNMQQHDIVEVGYHGKKGSEDKVLNLRNSIVWPNGTTDRPEGVKISKHLQVRLGHSLTVWQTNCFSKTFKSIIPRTIL